MFTQWNVPTGQQGYFTAFQDLNTCNHLFYPIPKEKQKKYFKVGQLSRNPCVIRAKYITLIKVDKKNRGYNESVY
jgi:hypothetical protein